MTNLPLRILLVEDAPNDAELLRRGLERVAPHFTVELAERLADAVARLAAGGFDAVLLDLGLPDSQGLDTVAQVHATAPGPAIVVLTGNDDEALGPAAIRAGAQDYLVKGEAQPRLVWRVLRYAVERKQAQEQLLRREQLLHVERAAHALAAEAYQQAAFLAEAGALLASSLDVEATIGAVADLAVPRMADWCVVHLVQADGSLRPLALTHAQPERAAVAWKMLQRFVYRAGEAAGAPKVVRTGEPELIPEIPDGFLETLTDEPEQLAFGRAAGLRSYMCVPLSAGGTTLGTLTFVAADSGRRYGPTDLALAQELAHTAALALENARLYTSLHESEQRYRTLVEMSPEAIFYNDMDGRIRFCNARAAALFGYELPADLVDRTYYELVAPEDLPEAERHHAAVRKEPLRVVERTFVRRDGSRFAGEVRGAPVLDDEGGFQAYILLVQDVTERKQAEQAQRALEVKIQQAQKLESLGVLAGGIAHDFNNLLMGIMGHAALTLLKLPRESPALPHVHHLERAAERAAELTNQMLAYSGKGKFVVRAIDLNRLVEEMAHLLQVSISKKAMLKYDFAADLPAVEGDATQLRQVVMNLITNAADAIGDRSGVVTVATGALDAEAGYLHETYLDQDLALGRYVYVEVSDTGVGMDAETKARIFEPFFTTKFTGRGLGLAAVLGIVRGHRGGIKVYSEPGKGTTFKILFPAAGVSLAALPEEPPIVTGSGRILVVDDDETVRSVARQMLEAFGYDVVMAADGREAVETFKAQASEVDVVLLDMTMPHLSGEETFRELRRLRPDVRVILSSGYHEQDATNRFAGKGLAGFIQKPYPPQTLAAKIRAALEGQ